MRDEVAKELLEELILSGASFTGKEHYKDDNTMDGVEMPSQLHKMPTKESQ